MPTTPPPHPATRAREPGAATARQPALAERVRGLGVALGLDAVGFARAEARPEASFLETWLARGYAGEMAWIGRRAAERMDPRRVLPGARTVIAAALRYPGHERPPAPGPARVSGYAAGEDYHEVLLDRLRAVASALGPLAGEPVRSRVYVDTGPVQERVWARLAGLGWVGKNTCLIDPARGSLLFLGVVLTDLVLPPDEPMSDHCGSCRACLDACPTDAFAEPYVLDATRCLSYTTIELREAIPEELREAQGDWIYGCDICQDVCPWNDRAVRHPEADPLALRERLAPRAPWAQASLSFVLELDLESWRRHTRRSAMRRAGYRGLLRNALVAAGNGGDRSLVPQIERHAEGDDPLLAEHARWALAQLERT